MKLEHRTNVRGEVLLSNYSTLYNPPKVVGYLGSLPVMAD